MKGGCREDVNVCVKMCYVDMLLCVVRLGLCTFLNLPCTPDTIHSLTHSLRLLHSFPHTPSYLHILITLHTTHLLPNKPHFLLSIQFIFLLYSHITPHYSTLCRTLQPYTPHIHTPTIHSTPPKTIHIHYSLYILVINLKETIRP